MPDEAKPFGQRLDEGMAWIETEWMVRQVQTHLIFGPIARHLSFGYLILAGAVTSFLTGLYATHKPVAEYIGDIIDKLIFLIVPFIFLMMSKLRQAILGWVCIKVALGIAAFITMTVGAGTSFQRHQADAWPLFFLGLIWLPGLEFIPKITPHQKYVTIGRLLLSIPCVYLGIKSGNWHWG